MFLGLYLGAIYALPMISILKWYIAGSYYLDATLISQSIISERKILKFWQSRKIYGRNPTQKFWLVGRILPNLGRTVKFFKIEKKSFSLRFTNFIC